MKIDIIPLILILVFCLLIVWPRSADSYGETDGLWTAGEKRQVITLLQKIERHTRGER